MIEEEFDPSETSKQAIHRDLSAKPEDEDDIPPNFVVIKQTQRFCSFQTFLYLAILYFLALSVFYLFISFSKSNPVDCQLQCSSTLLKCECEVNEVIWKGSTYVELSWLQGDQQDNMVLSSSISGVVLDQNNVSYIVSVESEIEESCFPTVCLSALGIIDREIVQKSIFRIIFQGNMPFKQEATISALFIESNSSYPQLSTKTQLGINLIFTVIIGIFTFLRKSIPLDVSIKDRGKIKALEQKTVDEEDIPAEVEEMNRKIRKKYEKAIKFYIEQCNQEMRENTESEYPDSDDELSMV